MYSTRTVQELYWIRGSVCAHDQVIKEPRRWLNLQKAGSSKQIVQYEYENVKFTVVEMKAIVEGDISLRTPQRGALPSTARSCCSAPRRSGNRPAIAHWARNQQKGEGSCCSCAYTYSYTQTSTLVCIRTSVNIKYFVLLSNSIRKPYARRISTSRIENIGKVIAR